MQSNESNSKQKTRVDEDPTEFLENMSEIVNLFDSISLNASIRKEARDRTAAVKEKGTAWYICFCTWVKDVNKSRYYNQTSVQGEQSSQKELNGSGWGCREWIFSYI